MTTSKWPHLRKSHHTPKLLNTYAKLPTALAYLLATCLAMTGFHNSNLTVGTTNEGLGDKVLLDV